jgi:uncharacterized hydrophobic protein (TIGR00271 family)
VELATALVDSKDGRIFVLSIGPTDTEQYVEIDTLLEPLIDELRGRNYRIERISHMSASIARGILDVAREKGADLVVVGIQEAAPGKATIGLVAQNVAETAPCDVVIYRGASSGEIKRIVVPCDGGSEARVAAHLGLLLGQHYDAPVEALYVQNAARSNWEGLSRIERTLGGLVGNRQVRRTVITASTPFNGILSHVGGNDMLVIGFSKRSNLDKWLYGDVVRPLINRAPGPVLLASPGTHPDGPLDERLRRWLQWVRPTLTGAEREGIVWQAEEMAAPSLDFFVLIVLSALLASLGLLLNSPAVIIGAMLVAPLMQPQIGFAVGLTTGRAGLSSRAFLTTIEGVLIGIGVALIAGRLIPPTAPTAEMLARSSPTLLDAYVAVASGLIGAYATARKDIPSALAGVAIAAALMPPLCTVGLGFTLGDMQLGAGALLLFFTNIVCISLAAAAVFLWLGFQPKLANSLRPWHYVVTVVIALATVPLVVLLLTASPGIDKSIIVKQSLVDSFAPASVVTVEIAEQKPGPTRIVATLRTSEAVTEDEVRQAELKLGKQLNEGIDLSVVVLQVVRPMQLTPSAPSDALIETPTPIVQ